MIIKDKAKNGQIVNALKFYLGVCGHDLKETADTPSIDMVDSMQLLFGNKHSKAYRSAKNRVGVTSKQVNAARQAFKK